MKHAFIASLVALSFGLSAQAMAKDLNTIDIFVGDFAAVAQLDVNKIVTNPMLSDAFKKGESSLDKEFAALKEAGIDYKKDISMLTLFVNDMGKGCGAVDAKKSLKAAIEDYAKKNAIPASDYKGITIYQDKDEAFALVSETRAILCDNVIGIKPTIDNIKAEKPVLMKDRLGAINNMYALLPAKADIRMAGKMTPSLVKRTQTYRLDGADGKFLAVPDMESGAVSVNIASGLDVQAIAKMKSEPAAADGAAVLNAQVGAVLADPSLNDMGLGFLAKSYKVSADKKNLKANISLTSEQLATILVIVSTLMDSGAPMPVQSSQPAPANAAK